MSNKFKFGTNKHQTLPFTIGGVNFFSKPLTVAEELPMADISDRYDGEDSGEKTASFIAEQTAYLADLLARRVAPSEANVNPLITPQWVMEHIGMSTMVSILQFLRSGKRPGESLELTNWVDELIEIDDLLFESRRLSFAEQLEMARIPANASTAETVTASLGVLAWLLNARRVRMEGEQAEDVTADWLGQHLNSEDVTALSLLLAQGAEPEGDDPNAAAGEDSLPVALTTSLA